MRFDRIVSCAVAIMIGAATIARADQAICLDKEADARKAASMLRNGEQMREYCAPCGDKGWKGSTIDSVEVYNSGPSCGWAVKVNGTDVDLAYVYVQESKKGKKDKKGDKGGKGDKGEWRNLATLVKLQVNGVPDTLPDDLPELAGDAAEVAP